MQIIRKARMLQEKASAVEIEKLLQLQKQEDTEPYKDNDFGLAVDIGTTTVAISLYQLKQKKFLGNLQEKNQQTQMGSDVVMRLMHCQRGHQEKLQRMIVGQIEQIAQKLSDGICRMQDIRKMTIVGNTTMCHIFAGQDISGLAGSPFQPAYQGPMERNGEKLGFKQLSETVIYILAGIDAHVGADAVSMITVLGMGQAKQLQLAIDIGTNAELALNDSQGRLLTCSVPAGPAFEGMEISCGMRGITGAIAGVRFAPQAGNVILDVIDGRPVWDTAHLVPKGVCGSGLIDAVAQLLQYGLINKDGYLLPEQEAKKEKVPEFLRSCLVELDGERGFAVYQGRDGQNSVILTQKDIRQFQLAKAAVQAGIKVLLSSQGLGLEQMEQIWIAGVFGGHISKGSAMKTGLFPAVSPEKISVVGNAAGEGAALALLSSKFKQVTEQNAQRAEHLELASSEEFQKEFLAAMELCETSRKI